MQEKRAPEPQETCSCRLTPWEEMGTQSLKPQEEGNGRGLETWNEPSSRRVKGVEEVIIRHLEQQEE